MPGRAAKKKEEEEEVEERVEEDGEKYELEELRDRINSSRASRFKLITNEFGLESTRRIFSRESLFHGIRDLSRGFFIHPDSRYRLHFPLYFSLAFIFILSKEEGTG